MDQEQREAYLKELCDEEFLKFKRVAQPLSKRRDLHAFMLLDQLDPESTGDIISASEHDEYWIDIDVDRVMENATEEQLRDIFRCGIRYDNEHECFAAFT